MDSSGDCYRFTTDLAQVLANSGDVEFKFGEEVTNLVIENKRVTAIETKNKKIPCDCVVIATGSATSLFMKKFGVRPLIYPIKGYSATYDIRDLAAIPELSVIDETNLVAFSKFDNRLRLSSLAKFAGYDLALNKKRLAILDDYAKTMFSDAIDLKTAEYWCELRPTTPSGPTYLGRINKYANLFINAGHSQLGWTLAAGAGRVIADIIDNKTPEITDVSINAGWLEAF